MAFALRPYRRFPILCPVTYQAGPFEGVGTVWNLSCAGWRMSGDLPMRPGEYLSLTVTLPNTQQITVPHAIIRWSRGCDFGVETLVIPTHTQARLVHYVRRLVRESLVYDRQPTAHDHDRAQSGLHESTDR